jgi:hypothetical protein
MAKLKLTQDIIDRIAQRVSQGAYPSRAAEAEGIDDQTYFDYVEDARKLIKGLPCRYATPEAPELLLQLYTRTKKADAVLEATLATKMMDNAMSSNNVVHQAIALERRYRDRWAQQVQVKDTNESLRIFKSLVDELKKPDPILTEIKPAQLCSPKSYNDTQ